MTVTEKSDLEYQGSNESIVLSTAIAVRVASPQVKRSMTLAHLRIMQGNLSLAATHGYRALRVLCGRDQRRSYGND